MEFEKAHILSFVLIFSFILNCQNHSSNDKKNHPVRVMSYNIKFDDKADTVNSWDQRKERVTNLVAFYKPDFLGTQEGLLHQLKYMEANLDSMQWIGVGRTKGKMEGEFSALFYNAKRFELVEESDSTIWLSKTPGKPSKNWDAALPRILTWGEFRDRLNGNQFYVFNTHFDHIGDTARAQSASLILETIQNIAEDKPVILTGDFNATPNSRPYAILTGESSSLRDAYHQTDLPHVGPLFSFEGYNVMSSGEKRRIDYIFINEKVEVRKHAIISDFRGSRYPSDHLPVLAEVTITSH